MQYLPEFATVALINFLAVLSPGPAFVLTTRNSLKYSRRTAFYTAVGLGLGILVHILNSLLGLGLLISQSDKLLNLIKYIGASYLIYLGYKSLTDKQHSAGGKICALHADLPTWTAIRMGFITNGANPKAVLFFLTIFTVIVSPTTPLFVKGLYGIEMALMEFTWFTILGAIISHRAIKQRIGKFQFVVERVMGIIFIIVAIKIALS